MSVSEPPSPHPLQLDLHSSTLDRLRLTIAGKLLNEDLAMFHSPILKSQFPVSLTIISRLIQTLNFFSNSTLTFFIFPHRFPAGIKDLANRIHAMGLKLGYVILRSLT